MEDADQIRLTLPAIASYARVARLAVTGIASRNGFSYDDVEDLRIATGELFGVVVEPEDPAARITLTCQLPGSALVLQVERHPTAPLPELSDLTRQILASVTDDLTVTATTMQITKVPKR